MNLKSLVYPGMVVVVNSTSVANAADALIVSPRAEIVRIEFSAGYSGDIGVVFNNAYDISVNALRLGVSIAGDKAYFDTYYQTSTSDSDTLLIGPENLAYDSSRDEFVAGLGYRIHESASLFAGFRRSESSSQADGGFAIDIESNAYFLGGSLSQTLSDAAVVAFNVAYVHIDTVNYKAVMSGAPTIPRLTGDGTGWKLGVSWASRLSENMHLTLSGDYFSYGWDADNLSGDNIRGDEDELFIRAGIGFVF